MRNGECQRFAVIFAALLACGISAFAQEALPAQPQEPLPVAGPYQNPDEKAAPAPKPGANSFAEGQARRLLESKGYANVSQLVNDPNGIWRGTATRDARQVAVSVDFQGHVTER